VPQRLRNGCCGRIADMTAASKALTPTEASNRPLHPLRCWWEFVHPCFCAAISFLVLSFAVAILVAFYCAGIASAKDGRRQFSFDLATKKKP